MRCGSNTSRRLGFLLELSQCLLGLNEESMGIQGGNARTSQPPLWNRFEFKMMRHLWWFSWDVDDTLWVMHFNAGFCSYPRSRKETQDGTRLLCVHFWRKSRPFLNRLTTDTSPTDSAYPLWSPGRGARFCQSPHGRVALDKWRELTNSCLSISHPWHGRLLLHGFTLGNRPASLIRLYIQLIRKTYRSS